MNLADFMSFVKQLEKRPRTTWESNLCYGVVPSGQLTCMGSGNIMKLQPFVKCNVAIAIAWSDLHAKLECMADVSTNSYILLESLTLW